MAPHVLSGASADSKPNLGGASTQDLRIPVKAESSDDLTTLSKRDIIIFSGTLILSCTPASPASPPTPPKSCQQEAIR